MCDNFLGDVETDYNIQIHPRPSPLIEIEEYFQKTDFPFISNLSNKEEIKEENEKLDQLLNKASDFQ